MSIRLPLLPPKDCLFILGLAVLGLGCWRSGLEIERLKSERVEIQDTRVDNRTEDVRRGPVKKVKTVVVAPDGTKTTTTSTDSGAVEIRKTANVEASHKETPPPPSRTRTRYVGLGVNPLAYTREWRARAGMNVLGAFDAGVALDLNPARLHLTRPMVELTYRF